LRLIDPRDAPPSSCGAASSIEAFQRVQSVDRESTEPALFTGYDRNCRFHMMFDPRPLSDWSQTLRELL
jgi:hypothetical protein